MRRRATPPPPPRSGSPSARGSSAVASPSGSSGPPFGRLVLAALRSVGIDYVALDLLRKAKKNSLDQHEYVILWRLLHDLVLVVLLDFEVDADAIREADASPTQLPLWQELVRHYLYDWGFVCHAFYSKHDETTPPSTLLLAFAWLLAYAKFFERQHEAILESYVQARPRLPPYRNDVAISDAAVAEAVAAVASSSQQLDERIRADLDERARLNQLQALVGRIHMHQRTLQASLEQYDRMLERLDQQQRENEAAHDDELIPAYALQVFASGKSQLELHVRVLTERLQMIEDEKLFYKWINGLVLQYTRMGNPKHEDATAALESQYAALYTDILHAKTALEQTAQLYKQIATIHSEEKKKWQQKAKTRTQQAKMDEKMEKLRHEIATNELFDVETLFLDRSHLPPVEKKRNGSRPAKIIDQADLERLQSQLERVMREITTDYCRVELI